VKLTAIGHYVWCATTYELEEDGAMSADNVNLVVGMYEGLGKGDLDGFFAGLDENVEFTEPSSLPYGGTYRGHDGMRDLFAVSGSHWENLRFEVLEAHGDGDTVFFEARTRGRSIATGAELDERSYYLVKVKDGKVAMIDLKVDTARVCEVLGTPPRSGA
jgi:ketosteroid isomerase-like protein